MATHVWPDMICCVKLNCRGSVSSGPYYSISTESLAVLVLWSPLTSFHSGAAHFRKDRNFWGFLWWWCLSQRWTQSRRSLCLWHRSSGSRFLSHLSSCSAPRTEPWCSCWRPRTCWCLKEIKECEDEKKSFVDLVAKRINHWSLQDESYE